MRRWYKAYSSAYDGYWGGCDNVSVLDIFRSGDDAWLESIFFVHSLTNSGFGGTDYYFANGSVYNGGVAVATMQWGDSCTWTGWHVHEMTYDGDGGYAYRTINSDHYQEQDGTYHGNWEGDCWTRAFWW